METFSALLALCAGNSPVTGEFPTQRPVTRSFNVFFDMHLNKQLSKQPWDWWFEMPSRPLWRRCNLHFSSSFTAPAPTEPPVPAPASRGSRHLLTARHHVTSPASLSIPWPLNPASYRKPNVSCSSPLRRSVVHMRRRPRFWSVTCAMPPCWNINISSRSSPRPCWNLRHALSRWI